MSLSKISCPEESPPRLRPFLAETKLNPKTAASAWTVVGGGGAVLGVAVVGVAVMGVAVVGVAVVAVAVVAGSCVGGGDSVVVVAEVSVDSLVVGPWSVGDGATDGRAVPVEVSVGSLGAIAPSERDDSDDVVFSSGRPFVASSELSFVAVEALVPLDSLANPAGNNADSSSPTWSSVSVRNCQANRTGAAMATDHPRTIRMLRQRSLASLTTY